jgi:hypothetical protein
MGSCASLLFAVLLAAEPARTEAGTPALQGQNESGGTTVTEPEGGAGVSPVELIPRLELRQSILELGGGNSLHDTTAEIDIQFLNRVLLRYEGALRILTTPAGQTSGISDANLKLIAVVASSPRLVVALIPGVVLDTASRPQLGAGKQQLILGAGAAAKPLRWWLPYLVVAEQLSVGGDEARPNVNQLTVDVGSIVFGKGQSWYKLDLNTVVDFEAGVGRFFGVLEVGRLLIGRVGLFMRAGTQMLGPRQLDYNVEVGVRYLFRLGT